MKQRLVIIALCVCVVVVVAGLGTLRAAEVLVEAEGFDDCGGWLNDPQFMDTMGSPYLLAHGLGKPVTNARTTIQIPKDGTYHVWVRTKDWLPPHHPGCFQVVVNGRALPLKFGANGDDWSWQRGGDVSIAGGKATLELQDLTGFDGRCDAILLTMDHALVPPAESDPNARSWRRSLLGLPEIPPSAGKFDLVVVGGGVAGCSAALSASRLGCRVALVQNRPVLGGNASSEIGLTPRDGTSTLVSELVERASDGAIRAEDVLRAEDNVSLFLNHHAYAVAMEQERIASVSARHTSTNQELSFRAPVFIDATGMVAIGSLAGADHRAGREARSEFGESLAPVEADQMHHGNTVIFRTRMADTPSTFPDVPWATAVSNGYGDLGGQVLRPGQDNRAGPFIGKPRSVALTHFWEYGQWLDPYDDAEHIRDHLLCALYGTFATVKEAAPRMLANLELDYVGYVPASGEFRRLVGDHILTENDIRRGTTFPDTVAINRGHFCLHYPGEAYDFRLGDWKWVDVKPFSVPFRCLYSRNVPNLMMAGKHISVSHVAGSCTKTILNGGQHGVAVGAAAYLCVQHGTLPRGVYENHIAELKELVNEVGGSSDRRHRAR